MGDKRKYEEKIVLNQIFSGSESSSFSFIFFTHTCLCFQFSECFLFVIGFILWQWLTCFHSFFSSSLLLFSVFLLLNRLCLTPPRKYWLVYIHMNAAYLYKSCLISKICKLFTLIVGNVGFVGGVNFTAVWTGYVCNK